MIEGGRARIGIVTGVEREAACLRAPGVDVRCSGANAAVAYELARALIKDGADCLLSVGLAGGLDPRLGPGAVIVANEVFAVAGETVDPMAAASLRTRLANVFTVRGHATSLGVEAPAVEANAAFQPAADLVERLRTVGGPKVSIGPIVGVDHVVAKRVEKLGLFTKTRAFAADMESHGVARAASEAEVPFGVVRVVIDPSNREVPSAMIRSVRPDGSTSIGAFLAGLALNPLEIGACLSLALDAAIAFRSLRHVGRGLAPALLRGL